ncbi:metal ABC transporter solute-binding protein, Zn/Mn family [Virgibacillus soli]|uniref:Zinc ABC transporter substrate-binding protein n=1 Tax=Paracerasibacillus soli TaxID=480284 RepID=A0ABU5CNL5_9BACI|nr:zinc ABC transporter substrate-binding protein [Virgibacillus soli]MDY0407940.1 zinc ABC transporter substrate-binding protein [Virgibacillus soli]
MNNHIKKTILTIGLTLLVVLSACGAEDSSRDRSEKLMIYTTLYPLQDFTEKIGGKFVEVKTILPPGADAHTFEPTSKQMVDIAKGDAFFYNGLGIEPYAETIASALKKEDITLVETAKNIPLLENHEHEAHDDHHHHGDHDPHVWLDPIRSIQIAKNIKDTLISFMPKEKETFEDNYQELKSNLENLDLAFQNLVKTKKNPEILVSHAAYGYWENDYGIEQIPIAGLSSSEEPSQKDLVTIIKQAQEKDIKYIIFEQNITPKVAEIIQKEIAAEPLYLHNLEVLTDADIANNEDYFSLMYRNIEVLDKALQ